jgi:tRNA threonylcarbamoyl adenosine modification protein (Sua5/YciO/YrdC/YwlC family)|tara:strand:- start:450 stop:1136 length:687 start_codon:yes stop_codon:yes gene_type:complete
MLSCRAAGSTRVLPATLPFVGEAVEALRREKVIAIPTDTIYGVAASACSVIGIERLYDAKQRSREVPMAVCVGDAADVSKYADVAHLNPKLLEELLPGPVTLLLRRKTLTEGCDLSPGLNPGLGLLGIRVPDSEFIRHVSRGFGKAIALTSANQSGTPSTLSVEEFENLWDKCEVVFDGGRIGLDASRSGSTIVNLSVPGEFSIARPGTTCDTICETLERYGIKKKQP